MHHQLVRAGAWVLIKSATTGLNPPDLDMSMMMVVTTPLLRLILLLLLWVELLRQLTLMFFASHLARTKLALQATAGFLFGTDDVYAKGWDMSTTMGRTSLEHDNHHDEDYLHAVYRQRHHWYAQNADDSSSR